MTQYIDFASSQTTLNKLSITCDTLYCNAIVGASTGGFSGKVELDNGTQALPSLTFSSDLDTGLYRFASNQLGVTCGNDTIAVFTPSKFEVLGTTESIGGLFTGVCSALRHASVNVIAQSGNITNLTATQVNTQFTNSSTVNTGLLNVNTIANIVALSCSSANVSQLTTNILTVNSSFDVHIVTTDSLAVSSELFARHIISGPMPLSAVYNGGSDQIAFITNSGPVGAYISIDATDTLKVSHRDTSNYMLFGIGSDSTKIGGNKIELYPDATSGNTGTRLGRFTTNPGLSRCQFELGGSALHSPAIDLISGNISSCVAGMNIRNIDGTVNLNYVMHGIERYHQWGAFNSTSVFTTAMRLYATELRTPDDIVFLSDTNTGIYRTSEDVMRLRTGGGDRFIVSSAGAISRTKMLVGDGTLSQPTLGFESDQDTGFYLSSSNNITVACGGSVRGLFNLDGVTSLFGFIAGNGTAATPTFRISGDTNTGIFSPTADTLSISTAGSERLRVTPIGTVSFFPTNGTGFIGSSVNPIFFVGSDVATGMYHPALGQLVFCCSGQSILQMSATGITSPNRIFAGNGTASDPSYTGTVPTNDNTGMFFGANGNECVSLTANGIERLRIASNMASSANREIFFPSNEYIRIDSSFTPGSEGTTAVARRLAYDTDYLYLATATNEWSRTPLFQWQRTHSTNLSGVSGTVACNTPYIVRGTVVELYLPTVSFTHLGAADLAFATALPAQLRPSINTSVLFMYRNDASVKERSGFIQIGTDGSVRMRASDASGDSTQFGAGTFSILRQALMYYL